MLMVFVFSLFLSASIFFPRASTNGVELSGILNGQSVGLRDEKEVRELFLSAEARLERCRANVRRATDDLKKREMQANRIKLQLRNKVLLAERKESEAVKARKIADAARDDCAAIQAESSSVASSAANCRQALETFIQEAKAAEHSFMSLKIEMQQQSYSGRVQLRSMGSSRLAGLSKTVTDRSRPLTLGSNRSAPPLTKQPPLGPSNITAMGVGSTRYSRSDRASSQSLLQSEAAADVHSG
jgi:hypothetical protein